MHLGIAVLFIALILFGILAFLQVSALILAPLVSVFVILLSQFSAGRITILIRCSGHGRIAATSNRTR